VPKNHKLAVKQVSGFHFQKKTIHVASKLAQDWSGQLCPRGPVYNRH